MHTPTFEELRELALSKRDDGILTVEFTELSTPAASPVSAADTFVVRHGFKPIGKAWRIVQRPEALDLLRRILFRDLAYRSIQMDEKTAQFIAESFLGLFSPYQSCYCTNGWIDEDGTAGGWTPITESTFELGVVAFDEKHIGMILIQDED